jgi:hypothetical protein
LHWHVPISIFENYSETFDFRQGEGRERWSGERGKVRREGGPRGVNLKSIGGVLIVDKWVVWVREN